MTTNGLFGVFCYIFSSVWGVFLAKTRIFVAKMLCFYEEIEAIYTKRTNRQTTDTNYLYHKYKPLVPEVQTLCTRSTSRLYY